MKAWGMLQRLCKMLLIPLPYNAMIFDRATHYFFDDLVIYLFSMISFTLTHELYISGNAGIYEEQHRIMLTAKQHSKNLFFYPAKCLNPFFRQLLWPNQIDFTEQQSTQVPPYQALPLNIYERPSFAFLLSMFVNYYERYKTIIEIKFTQHHPNWPDEWNFGRIVRNALSHGGRINFENPNASPVYWNLLTYMPKDNGRQIIHTDLWPGDMIYLMRDMNSYL